mmetsp:Transcript_29607/g.84424  ORF Transcript_29607/g.84424 Transcript_29607/m.84424 type:complete len:641 (-) Transcript_29607:315-2237(-)
MRVPVALFCLGVRALRSSASLCAVGDTVRCPGSNGTCAGEECCPPGVQGGESFPCPSAPGSFTGCDSPTKVADCVDGPSLPTREWRQTLAGKSVYFVLVDRFARSGGEPLTKCDTDNHWCNGTLRGVIDRLDYIQGMGFDCIWITPVVYQWPGESTSGTGCMGYWAYNLYEIDPHFGTKEDMKDLTRSLHERGMCLMYDFVANHMGPIHSEDMLRDMVPFNDAKYFNQLFRGPMTFDEYAAPGPDARGPTQAMWSHSGGQCTVGRSCHCYECVAADTGMATSPDDFDGPCNGEMAFDEDSPCPRGTLSPYCMLGDYACEGYNETITQQGWFFDLGDLNQSHPFVRRKQKEWIRWFVDEYDVDLLRLDTAGFIQSDFLAELQDAARVPIIGEVTATNLTYHAGFQQTSPTTGRPTLAGVLNFPLYYTALAGFCGKWFPYSTFNLTFLGERMEEQLAAPYADVNNLGNFMDNHDTLRLAKVCGGDASRIYNALAWTMLAKGVPIVYYGTEQLFTSVRKSLWDDRYDTTTEMYGFIRALNLVRKEFGAEVLGALEVVDTKHEGLLVFRRGGRSGVWVFVNNFREGHGAVRYCGELPDASDGGVWVDAISQEAAVFDAGCYRSADSRPKVLVRRQRRGLRGAAP